MLNAPPSRYRIVEKGGRLIVYDRGVQVSVGAKPVAKQDRPSSALNPVASVKETLAQATTPFSDVKPFPLLMLDQMGLGFIKMMSNGTDANGLIILTRRVRKGITETVSTTRVTKEQASVLGRGALLLIAAAVSLVLGISSGSGAGMLFLSLVAAISLAAAFVGSGPTVERLQWEKS